jgi:hypothetical protein
MIGRLKVSTALVVAMFAALLLPAAANGWTDDRNDKPVRSGTETENLYGPFNIPAAAGGSPGQIYNQINSVASPCPTSDCRITDIVPDLVRTTSTGQTRNIQDGLMLHHFLLKDPGRADPVCPTGLQGQFGIRFFAAGNERTHLHMPQPYGYAPASTSWTLITHIYNFNAAPEQVYVKASYRYRPLAETKQATPYWLDVDGCNDSEYSVPTGYSDTHVAPPGAPPGNNANQEWWTSTVDGNVLSTAGHSHDIDVDESPFNIVHDHTKGGGIAVSAEVRNGQAATYFGPDPSTNAFNPPNPGGGPTKPADLNGGAGQGSTLCRSEAKYNTPTGDALRYNDHMDTMTSCGIFSEVPAGAQPELYPARGEFPSTGYPIRKGQQIRLHSEYWNNTGHPKTNAMGIMVLWVGDANYATPQSALSLNTALVPVYRQCGTGANPVDGAHSPPLNAGGSCQPPATQGVAHMGSAATGQANTAVVAGDPATNADTADVTFGGSLTDIRATSPTGGDYDPNGANPELTLVAKWRMTDLNNASPAPGPSTPAVSPATATDLDFSVPVNCVATGGAEGANCNISSSADAVTPGSVVESKATVISVFRVRVNDSGPDNIRANADDRLFAQQGFYVP